MGINREIRFVTAGNNDSVSQAFYNNYLADSRPVQNSFFPIEMPMYYTYGGTLNYYGPDPYSIFTNLVRPPIRFVFTANTANLSGNSFFVHEIYRLDYNTYKLYSDNQIEDTQQVINRTQNDSNRGPRPIQPTSNNTSRDFLSPSNVRAGNNLIPIPEKLFGEPLTFNDLATIQQYFTVPIATMTASTSAITGNIYDLYLDQFVKEEGQYKKELFVDKGQYFINTKIVFTVDLNKDYAGFFDLPSGSTIGIPDTWNDFLTINATNNDPSTITTGPFSGLQVVGNFFVNFVVPDKPKLEYPIADGQLDTYTPEFRWSNGDTADSFLLRINYNTGDTGFTGTFFNYPIEKSEKNLKNSTSKTKGPNSEFETNKSIYTAQIPVKSNSSFIYQVGNSKEIIDIFNVRRNVITFSDYYLAISQPQPIQTFVEIEVDSNTTSTVSSSTPPPSLDYESALSSFSLSGVVSGSTVTGATIQLIYPNSSFALISTDLTGFYSFSGLSEGYYTATTIYRGYQQDIRVINMTGDTSLGFKLNLLWSNDVDTWGKLAGESYYT